MAGGSFYRFQVREKKKERLKALKKGFQEDLRNVEGLRKKGRKRVRIYRLAIKLIKNRVDLTNFYLDFSQCNHVDLCRNLRMMPVCAEELN